MPKFDGFLKVYEEAKDKKDDEDESLENKLPELNEGQALVLNSAKADEHYTEPPPRYNEASLVKELEETALAVHRPMRRSSILFRTANMSLSYRYPGAREGSTRRRFPTSW